MEGNGITVITFIIIIFGGLPYCLGMNGHKELPVQHKGSTNIAANGLLMNNNDNNINLRRLTTVTLFCYTFFILSPIKDCHLTLSKWNKNIGSPCYFF